MPHLRRQERTPFWELVAVSTAKAPAGASVAERAAGAVEPAEAAAVRVADTALVTEPVSVRAVELVRVRHEDRALEMEKNLITLVMPELKAGKEP